MADITPQQLNIQIEAARFRSPVSESLIQRMGAAINFVNTIGFHIVEFTASGTWTVPPHLVGGAYFLGCGGGGGGGSAGAAASNASSPVIGSGGAGGCGSIPNLIFKDLIIGDVLTINIGAGGVGGAAHNVTPNGSANGFSGAAGGNTTVTGLTINGSLALSFLGALGGQLGIGQLGTNIPNGPGGAGNPAIWSPIGCLSLGGAGGGYTAAGQGNGFSGGIHSYVATAAAGGVGRSQVSGGGRTSSSAGGGGGGAGFGLGGVGGINNWENPSSTVGAGGAGGIGAGGGGSGGASNVNNTGQARVGAGGKGGDGYVGIIYFGAG